MTRPATRMPEAGCWIPRPPAAGDWSLVARRCALSSARFPREPGMTFRDRPASGMSWGAGPRNVMPGTPARGAVIGVPFGSTSRHPKRPLPKALPVGAPLNNVGTQGSPQAVTLLPTLSKTAPRRTRRRRPANSVDDLTPEAVSARWTAPSRSRIAAETRHPPFPMRDGISSSTTQQMQGIPSHSICGVPRDSTAIHGVNRFRIRPSWATDATCRP
jgi:hypothetical protein